MLDWWSDGPESPPPPPPELPGRNGDPITQGDMVLIDEVPYRVTEIWSSYVVLCKLVPEQQHYLHEAQGPRDYLREAQGPLDYYGDAAWFTETCERIEPHYGTVHEAQGPLERVVSGKARTFDQELVSPAADTPK